MSVTPSRIRTFRRHVLGWYGAHGRDLPWRRTQDPYAILVSEILLHQTQVKRVAPVYEAFLRRYPTAAELARTPLREIRELTDPLGYKVRGRWLKAAAREVTRRGAFPATLVELQELPGVGRYTAGAVMSFAHGKDAPILDTNVARLLTRYFGAAPSRARLWRLAAQVIPRGQGHRINQALMDLGALLCVARRPRCAQCPLRRACAFHRPAGARP
jgi:A/G-specific adenine glycosylase